MGRKILNDKLKAAFRSSLTDYRNKTGLTQKAMAELLEMDTRSYIELDHGKNNCSSLTLTLFLIYMCKTPNEREAFIMELKKEFENTLN